MAASVTEATRAPEAAFPHHAAGGASRAVAATNAREAFVESLSRELRCTLDEDGRFLHLEGAWQSVLGWQPKELRGWHWEEIVHPADRARTGKALARLRATGACERDFEMRLAVPSGGHRVITWTVIAGAGRDRIIGVGRDLTDDKRKTARDRRTVGRLRRRNRDLQTQLRELEERCDAVEHFAGMAAHQLAEPLVIAESSAILLAEELRDGLDPVLRDRLHAMERSASRARLLIDALLQDARAAGQMLALGPVDVGEVVEETLASLSSMIDERRAEAVVGPLPVVHAEPRLLFIIVQNLVLNALKYGPREGGRVRIRADRDTEGWRLSVNSDGFPIADADVRRVFEPFRRGRGERRAPGQGLGLAICARLVERLGGTTGVQPGTTVGNTFWFVLPAAR
jgi:PAS domain S-box-containing protein